MSNIKEWMNNKTILITGGSGFMGKVLTEKLLRCCPDLKKIYLLIRTKGGLKPEERWAQITKDELFSILLNEQPNVFDEKVVVLNGDMSHINFGLSEDTIEELRESVNIIFHSAATVRFNDPLHKAFLANTRGTLEMCKLAARMENLECFVHVSTTYCNYNLNYNLYEEKVYEPCQDWRTVLKLVETERPEIINTISLKIIQSHPNTYTFSKSLSEKIVEEYSKHFPAVIARPSVVVGMIYSPLPGWTDNLNGVTGVTTGVCKGVIRVMKADRHCSLDYVAVDVAINALIVSAWDKATSTNKELSVYNCGYGYFSTLDFADLTTAGLAINEETTLKPTMWWPFLYFTANDFYFHILYYLLHVIPAAIVDSILILQNKKPKLMKITIKIYLAILALAAFTMRDITFDSRKFIELWDKIKPEDEQTFPLRPPPDFSLIKTMSILHKGVKLYFLKEKMEDNENHKKQLRRLYYLDRFVRAILIVGMSILLYRLLQTIW